MALPTNQEIDNAIRTSNTGTDADRPIRSSTNELLKAFRQEIANTQQDLANKVNNSTFNALADVARSGNYGDLSERPQQYGGAGQNTDGYMTQKAVSDALGNKADLVAGKIPIEQLPSSLASGVVFKGTWDATTNQDNSGSPLPATPINDGEYYIVNTAGTQFGLTFAAGDWIIAVYGQWYKLEPDSTVSSVNGQTGAVVIDVGVTSVGVTVPTGLVVANTPVTSAGTIDIELAAGYKIPTLAELEDRGIEPPAGWLEAGNETKYLAGDGTLKDIPSDTQSDYAQTNPNAPDYIKNKPALFSGSYDDLEDKPTIPTKTSELINDSEFITDASLAGLVSEAQLSDYTQRTADETITGDWDFQGAMKVGDYTYNTMYGPYRVEKITTYTHPSLSSPMNIAYGINIGNTFSSMRVAFNISDLGLGKSIVTDLFAEESIITGGSARVRIVTGKEMSGTVTKGIYIEAGVAGSAGAYIGVVSRSDGTAYLALAAGTEPVHGLYADNILTESSGITVKAALDNKVDKVQVKEIVTANKVLTAADSGKLLLISADGITITLPTGIPDFTVDIVKMDEYFTTLAQTSSPDKFREDVSTITIIKDVTIFSTGVVGKEYVAIGAYEV